MVEAASIFALGAVRCEVAGREALLHGGQPKIVLTYLCGQHEAPVSSDELADAVWDSEAAGYSSGALRGVVSKVRRFLAANVGEHARLENLGGCYRLVHDDEVRVDLELAEHDLRVAAELVNGGSPAAAAVPASRAVALLDAPLLPGIDRGWLQLRRAEIAQLRRRAMCTAARIRSELGDHDDAVDLAGRAVRLDPLDEAAHRALITAHVAAGDRGSALRSYELCRRVLRDELGVRPSPATELLHDRVAGL